MDQKTEKLIERAEAVYEKHFTLFMHSDHFVQQRTTQYSTVNTLLFAVFGILMNFFLTTGGKIFIANSIAVFVVASIGLFFSYLWLCTYKRSALYRNIHRRALERLDKFFEEALDLNFHPNAHFMGPFTLRHHVAYKEEPLQLDDEPRLCVTRFSKKRERFNVESIPLVMIFMWVLSLIFCIAVMVFRYPDVW